jgi:hypothetical protein
MHAPGHSAAGIYRPADIPHFVELMKGDLEELKSMHNGLFLGFEQLRRLANNKMYSLKVGAWGSWAVAAVPPV